MGFQSGFNQAPCKSTGVSVGFLVSGSRSGEQPESKLTTESAGDRQPSSAAYTSTCIPFNKSGFSRGFKRE
jgi:hypothetical protein